LDDGTRLATYEELSPSAKQPLSDYAGLKGVDSASYIALAFGAPGSDAKSVLVVHTAPLKVELYSPEGHLQVVLNERALLHFETSAAAAGAGTQQAAAGAVLEKDRHGGKQVVDYGEDGTYAAP
jgi:hypothetical protein